MFTNLCAKLWVTLGNLKSDERGVTAIEYALMAAAVAVLFAVVFAFTGNDNWFAQIFGSMTDKVESAIGAPAAMPQ